MTHTDMVFLSGLLWLLAGFCIGYRYHVLKVREIQARRAKRIVQELRDRELDQLLAKVAVESLERHVDVFGQQVVVLANPKTLARN